MLAEQALSEFPLLGEHPLLLEQGVYPGDSIRHSLVFDAVASLAVVFHHLSGAAAALLVYLIEDRIAGRGFSIGLLSNFYFPMQCFEKIECRMVSGSRRLRPRMALMLEMAARRSSATSSEGTPLCREVRAARRESDAWRREL